MESQLSSIAIDLTRLHRRTVTSFYSNLVTRPTGRAVRLGLEKQLLETAGVGGPYLSVLDFSQVRVLDYSCADEIIAKLLLRYREEDRPADAYFVARGLHEHHLESVEAVLERHSLLLVTEEEGSGPRLLGPCSAVERACWSLLLRHGRVAPESLNGNDAVRGETLLPTLGRFVAARVAVRLGTGTICPIPQLNHV